LLSERVFIYMYTQSGYMECVEFVTVGQDTDSMWRIGKIGHMRTCGGEMGRKRSFHYSRGKINKDKKVWVKQLNRRIAGALIGYL
jgi:hypothetical protein